MAKALFGHVGGNSAAAAHEVAVLRRRIADLEDEISRLTAGIHDRELAEILETASH